MARSRLWWLFISCWTLVSFLVTPFAGLQVPAVQAAETLLATNAIASQPRAAAPATEAPLAKLEGGVRATTRVEPLAVAPLVSTAANSPSIQVTPGSITAA